MQGLSVHPAGNRAVGGGSQVRVKTGSCILGCYSDIQYMYSAFEVPLYFSFLFYQAGRAQSARPAGPKITLRFPCLYIYIYIYIYTYIYINYVRLHLPRAQ